MAIEIKIVCDECGQEIDSGEKVFCANCYNDANDDFADSETDRKSLEKRNVELSLRVDQLEAESVGLRETIRRLEKEIEDERLRTSE